MRAMREALSSTRRSSWVRTASLGLVATLTFVLNGDRGRAAASGGIDPLEILNLQVRPNAIIVLDSSGSMRQRPQATTEFYNPSGGGTVGDDRDSKLWQAKDVIRNVISANETKVSFMFGQYEQDAASLGPEASPTFLYKVNCASTDTACQNNANAISISGFGTAGLRRSQTTDLFTEADGSKTYYLESNTFYNGVTVNVMATGACGVVCTTTIGAPPKANPAPVKVQMLTSLGVATGTPVTFFFQGVRWSPSNDPSSSCDGFRSLVPLQPCTNDDQLTLVSPHLLNEVITNASGDIVNPDGSPWNGLNSSLPSVAGGIRASGRTPIANSLDDIKAIFDSTIFPGRTNPDQRTFVIFVTDGDDTCGGYLRSAFSAQRLYNAAAADPAQRVQTFVVVFGSAASTNQANQIAFGGSGMTAVPASGFPRAWNRDATAAEVAACTTCQGALTAADAASLQDSIQAAIDRGANSGEFSDQQSITESVFELGGLVDPPGGPVDPLDPDERFNATIPVLLQSTFEMPTFAGHLKAFRNAGGSPALLWDAGDMLCRRVTGYKASATAVPAICDVGNAGSLVTPPAGVGPGTGAGTPTFSALTTNISRRIFTTTQNGVNSNYTPANLVNTTSNPAVWGAQVALWPPAASVDPGRSGNNYPAGSLDDELGIASLSTVQLASQFGACAVTSGGTNHPECSRSGFAAKEARRVILAFTAGAQVALGPDGKPQRDASGNMLFKARPWILAESTLAAPGISGPPAQDNTDVHPSEYTLYRDGPRNAGRAVNGTAAGFGLRNPDDDGQASSQSDLALKPVMSVVYHATNHMLHAFRAGPSCTAVDTGVTPAVPTCSENGGEELWAFVPYDQLAKLRARMLGQTRSKPAYVMAAPVRFADVFVPGTFNTTIGGVSTGGAGVWRTLLLAGRGAGGKSLSAIDVTVPGPFTTLSTQTRLPLVVWNRGNPDTTDGVARATCSPFCNNTTSAGQSDYNAYRKMGETWSVPAVGFVTAANNVTTRKPSGVEFVAWMGSGYSDVSGEGTTFYALDALTGDVLAAHDVASGTSSAGIPNALVASPSAFAALPLSFFDLVNGPNEIFNPITEAVTAVYFPDLHSRVFRFLPDAPATPPAVFRDLSGDGDQPVANAVSLLNFNSDGTTEKPHVFLETGNDSRVPIPTGSPFFRMYGLRDDSGVAADVFSPIDFPSDPVLGSFRGTVQPATVFNVQGKARVFFAGTRFNPPGTSCASTFDSVVFALEGATGQAAYDLGGPDNSYVTLQGQRVNAVRTSGGQLVVDLGLGAQNPPPPPAPPTTVTGDTSRSNVAIGSKVPGTIPFKLGTAVCR